MYHDMWKWYEIHISVFISKVLLSTATLTYVLNVAVFVL